MKSDLHAVRTALICFELGCLVVVVVCGCAGVAATGGADGGAATGDAVFVPGVAVSVLARTAAWQFGETCAAFALKQSRSSGLLGLIQEQ